MSSYKQYILNKINFESTKKMNIIAQLNERQINEMIQ